MALSDLLGPALQLGSTILSVGSQLSRAQATRSVGIRRQAESAFEAGQLEQNAEASRGIGLRAAQDLQIKGSALKSQTVARAATSGAGASDPTVVDLISRNAGEIAYRQALAMYESSEQARRSMMRASAARHEGQTSYEDSRAAATAAEGTALSTVLTGGLKTMSMFEKYWSMP